LEAFNKFHFRVMISLILYILFISLYLTSGLYRSYIIILIPSLILTLYFSLKDGGIWFGTTHLFSAFLSILYFLLIFVFFPPNKRIGSELVSKVLLEELFFRFSLIGILKSKLDLLKRPIRTSLIILLMGVLFSALHIQYTLLEEYVTVSILGMNYVLIFLEIGLIPTIVSHLTWNLYKPHVLLQAPFLLLALSNLYYRDKKERKRDRARRIKPPI